MMIKPMSCLHHLDTELTGGIDQRYNKTQEFMFLSVICMYLSL